MPTRNVLNLFEQKFRSRRHCVEKFLVNILYCLDLLYRVTLARDLLVTYFRTLHTSYADYQLLGRCLVLFSSLNQVLYSDLTRPASAQP